jgi:hypothetical protein
MAETKNKTRAMNDGGGGGGGDETPRMMRRKRQAKDKWPQGACMMYSELRGPGVVDLGACGALIGSG